MLVKYITAISSKKVLSSAFSDRRAFVKNTTLYYPEQIILIKYAYCINNQSINWVAIQRKRRIKVIALIDICYIIKNKYASCLLLIKDAKDAKDKKYITVIDIPLNKVIKWFK
jgi:hypothetical protein